MRDWDTRINTLKSDIQAAREKYVIPFMKAKPKPASPQNEVSQTPSVNYEENKDETKVEATTENLYENKDPTSSLDLIEKTNEAKNETNLGLTEEITNKIDNALEQTKSDGKEAPTVNVEEAVASAEEVPTVSVEEAVASAEEAPTVNVEEAVASAEEAPTVNVEEAVASAEQAPTVNVEEAVASAEEAPIENKEENVDTNQTKKTELELLEERDEDSLTEEEEDRMYELRRLRAQKIINDEVREEEQAEFKKADEEIAHLKTLLKPKKKKLPKGYVE